MYRDRQHAGQELAASLGEYADRFDVLVLALPRGGVPVAYEVARTLHAPLDVMLVRKLGVPGHEELALGAIASGGVRSLNPEVVDQVRNAPQVIATIVARETEELERRETLYRRKRPAAEVQGKTTILIDDGIATGATMRAAVIALRKLGAARVVVAVPVAPPEAQAQFMKIADDFVCPETPANFRAVGYHYRDFSQTSDAEVTELLSRSAQERGIG